MHLTETIRLLIFGFVSALLAYTFYFKLGGYALLDNNEGLYAQIPLEMMLSGDTVIPTLNGNPYIEKPPLLYWLIMMVYKCFGVSEWTSRAVTATAGLLTCVTMGYFARLTRYEETSWLCPMMLGTCVGMIIFSRMVFFDVLLTFFFTLSMMSFYMWYEKENKSWLYISYAALALATLAKGLLAPVIAFLIVIIFFISDLTRFKKVLRFFSVGPILLYIFIAAPWHILASLQEDGFAWFYFLNEHIYRFLDMREPRDYYHGPFYYYIPRLLGYIFPWTLFVPYFLNRPSIKGMPKLNKFLWIWFFFILLFFSLSKAKANYYIVLGMPPLIMSLSMRIEDMIDTGKSITMRALVSTIIVLLTGALVSFHYLKIDPRIDVYKSILTQEILIAWCVFALIGIVAMWALPKKAYIAPIFLASIMVPVLYIGSDLTKLTQDYFSIKYLVGDIPRDIRRNVHAKIYMYRDFEKISAVPYYLRRPIPVIQSHSHDLAYGQENPQNPQYFVSLKEFEKDLQNPDPLFIISRDKYKKELMERGLCVKSTRWERILVSNQCEET